MVYAKITPKTIQKEMQKLNGMFNTILQTDAIPQADMNSSESVRNALDYEADEGDAGEVIRFY